MNKLKLDLEMLSVESFDVGADTQGRGTVEGLARTVIERPIPATDDLACFTEACGGGVATAISGCPQTCGATCAISCVGTCYDYTCQSCSCPDVQTCGYTCHYPGCA